MKRLKKPSDWIMIMFNSSNASCQYAIPTISKIKTWQKFLDTSEETPKDIFPNLDGPKLAKNGVYTLPGKSMAVFVAK